MKTLATSNELPGKADSDSLKDFFHVALNGERQVCIGFYKFG